MLGIDGIPVVFAAGWRCALVGAERDFQPHHILVRHQQGADVIRGPGVIENRFPFLVARDHVGHQCRVGPDLLGDRGSQSSAIEQFFYDALAGPARRAAGKVGLAVTVGIEQLRDGRVLQLAYVGDSMFIRGVLVDQVALQGVG
ncbi:hypothetical protein D3C84_754920 [compost metagenome]